ncbi:MAG: hypothetical protein KC636_14680 [Myxococcales bacterium]|nr:hypothetical protein [Myxococcales bacterium]
MTRPLSILWLALVGFAALCLLPIQPASAASRYGVVTIDLRPEVGVEVPTHLCVVSEAAGPRTRETMAALVEARGGAAPGQLRLRPKSWGGAAAASACEGPDGACAPAVSLPAGIAAADLHVACTADALLPEDTASSEPRALVLMLEHLEGSPPRIESIKLAGGVATVGVQSNLAQVEVTARSLGGHYLAQGRSQRAEAARGENRLIVLPLQPRCRWTEALLPHRPLRAADRGHLDVRISGARVDAERCVGPLWGTRTLKVLLPRVAPGSTGALELSVAEATSGQPPARFGARWDGPWPTRALALHATQISFVWRRPACVVASDMCPRAQLESGITCAAQSAADGCHYLCPGQPAGDEATAIEPPLTVHFEKDDPSQRWSETLTRVGQPLSSYVPGDPVYLHADTRDWATKVPGARIEEIAIYGVDGSVRKFPVHDEGALAIPIPRPSCEPLRFRIIGDRSYREGLAPIRDGALQLGKPEKTARVMTFNITLLQGGTWAVPQGAPDTFQTPVYFLGLLQIAANFRPRNPKYARIAGELRLGGTIGQWGYFGFETLTDDPRRVDEKIAWLRFLVEPALVVDIIHPVALSAGLGIGWSWPLSVANTAKTLRFAPVLAPSLDARFTIRKWLAFVVQGRLFLGERTLATIPEGTQATRHELTTISWTGLYGLQFSF